MRDDGIDEAGEEQDALLKGRSKAGHWERLLPWAGALLGIGALLLVLRGFEFGRFRAVVAGADFRFVLLIPVIVLWSN
jgi:hypothetical protein